MSKEEPKKTWCDYPIGSRTCSTCGKTFADFTDECGADKAISFTYRNHRGEVGQRTVIPECVEFIKDPGYDYQPGWFLSGLCLGKKERRSFALSHIVLENGLKLEFK